MPASMPEPYGNLIESLIALTMAATVTERVDLGTSIIVTPMREPVLLAKQLASIDAVSGGRLILGAGVGWLEDEFAYLNANFENRGARFDEGLALSRVLCESGQGSFQGQFNSIDDALFSPLPTPRREAADLDRRQQRPSPSAAPRPCADGWHPVGLTPEELAAGLSQLREQSDGPRGHSQSAHQHRIAGGWRKRCGLRRARSCTARAQPRMSRRSCAPIKTPAWSTWFCGSSTRAGMNSKPESACSPPR